MTSAVENGYNKARISFVPESLVNKISARDMGSRLVHERLPYETRGNSSRQKPMEELASFLFGLLDNLPSDVLLAACESVLTIMGQQDASDIDRKRQIEDLLDLKRQLTSSELEKISRIAELYFSAENSDTDLIMEDSDPDLFEDSDDGEEMEFVSLNDPIRVTNSLVVRAQDVDSQWLATKLDNSKVSVPNLLSKFEELSNLSLPERQQRLEIMLGPSHLNFAQLLSNNFDVVMLYTKLALAPNGLERERVLNEINLKGLSLEEQMDDTEMPRELDLKTIGRPISAPVNLRVDLPPNSELQKMPKYEKYTVPPQAPAPIHWNLRYVDELPEFAKRGFLNLTKLNAIQSRVCDVALQSDINLLVCSPTGSGKTNIALLAILRCLNLNLKVVYVSPQKALVQEQVSVLQSRLVDSEVAELSGDQALSRHQLQLLDVIVATPEKWDIVSRKKTNIDVIRSVGLVVIDEIHLLHDECRGGVIENIVMRHKNGSPTRLLGLSASLPNYTDVARFLEVPSSGLFYFDSSFRPVPLEQHYIGVTSTNPLKQRKHIDEVFVEQIIINAITKKKQVLAFVHSRKDTEKARTLLIQETELDDSQVGIHHAGLTRNVRNRAEEQFKNGDIRVLICTATLAWGVNLPAATVIIKGTQLYNPNTRGWQPLAPQDVLQMLGRAGRPGYDSQGTGVIITTRDYIGFYASIANLLLPIESHLMYRICDSINAEVVLNNIKNLDQACTWISGTYWAVRWKADPRMYGDNFCLKDLAHSVLCELKRSGSLVYSYPDVRPTTQGELAANFYINPASMAIYSRKIKPWLSESDIIRVFAQCDEFEALSLRAGEHGEITKLMNTVPYPVRDNRPTKEAKICVLLQAYIGQMPVMGQSLLIDCNYISQSASRLFRAIFELAIELGWGKLAKNVHKIFLQIDQQMWMASSSPFRQFPDCPEVLAEKAEKCGVPWSRLFDLRQHDLSKVFRIDDIDVLSFAEHCLNCFPRFKIIGSAKPLTHRWIHVQIEIVPQCDLDSEIYEPYETFYVIVEDQQQNILGFRRLTVRDIKDSKILSFHFELPETYHSYLYPHILSDRWLNFDECSSISLRNVSFPKHESVEYSLEISNQGVDPTSDLALSKSALLRTLEPLLLDINRTVYLGIPPGVESYNCAKLVVAKHRSVNHNTLIIKPDDMNVDLSDVPILDVGTAEKLSRKTSGLEEYFVNVDCLLCLNLHSVGSTYGHLYEILITRLKNFWNYRGVYPRIVGLGLSVSSAQSIGSWIGAKKSDVGNFGLDVRQAQLSISIEKFDGSVAYTLKSLSVENILKRNSNVAILLPFRSQVAVAKHELEINGFTKVSVFHLSKFDRKPGQYDDLIMICDTIEASELLSIAGSVNENFLLYTREPDYAAYVLCNPIPCESNMPEFFGDALLPAICQGAVTNPQQAIEWLSLTFAYRRFRINPGYYGDSDLQEWASELVESSFEQLNALELIEIVDEETLDIKPTALAHIVSQTGATIKSIKNDINTVNEDSSINDLDAQISLAIAMDRPLSLVFKLIDYRQCRAQRLPFASSSLLQIPYIDEAKALRCQDAGIKSVIDFIGIDDDDLRGQLVGFTNDDPEMIEIATFVNQFPIVDIVAAKILTTSNSISQESVIVEVDIECDLDSLPISTQLSWFIVIGNIEGNTVLGFKRLEKINEASFTVEVITDKVPGPGSSVWLMCGDVIDADKEYQLQ